MNVKTITQIGSVLLGLSIVEEAEIIAPEDLVDLIKGNPADTLYGLKCGAEFLIADNAPDLRSAILTPLLPGERLPVPAAGCVDPEAFESFERSLACLRRLVRRYQIEGEPFVDTLAALRKIAFKKLLAP